MLAFMRVVKEIPHPDYKITLFAWNNRYIIKIEQGYLEQTFKIDQFEVAGDPDVEKLVDATFIKETLERFQQMTNSLRQALDRH
jgi:hypothetical protein